MNNQLDYQKTRSRALAEQQRLRFSLVMYGEKSILRTYCHERNYDMSSLVRIALSSFLNGGTTIHHRPRVSDVKAILPVYS